MREEGQTGGTAPHHGKNSPGGHSIGDLVGPELIISSISNYLAPKIKTMSFPLHANSVMKAYRMHRTRWR